MRNRLKIIASCKAVGACGYELKRLLKAKTDDDFYVWCIENLSWILNNNIDVDWLDFVDNVELDGWDTSILLRCQPQLFDKLDVKRMDQYDIASVLKRQPQLKDKFK